MAARLDAENIKPCVSLCIIWWRRRNGAISSAGTGASYVLPAMQKHGPVVAWIVDDTGFPKKGKLRIPAM